MHSQIHRQGHEGPAGNPAHFLSKLVIWHPAILHPAILHPLHSQCREGLLSLYVHRINKHSEGMPGLWLPWQSQKAGHLPPWNTRHPAQSGGGGRRQFLHLCEEGLTVVLGKRLSDKGPQERVGATTGFSTK